MMKLSAEQVGGEFVVHIEYGVAASHDFRAASFDDFVAELRAAYRYMSGERASESPDAVKAARESGRQPNPPMADDAATNMVEENLAHDRDTQRRDQERAARAAEDGRRNAPTERDIVRRGTARNV